MLYPNHTDDQIQRELLDIVFSGLNADIVQVCLNDSNYIKRIVGISVTKGEAYADVYDRYREVIEFDLQNTIDAYRQNMTQ